MRSIRGHWPLHHAGIPGKNHLCASCCPFGSMPQLSGHGGSLGDVASHPAWPSAATHVTAPWQQSVYIFAFVCIQYMFFQSKTCFHACKCDVRQAIENALDLFKEANGEAMMLRKHHCMLHLAKHLQLWGFLPNCWSLERKHKTIMMFANQTKKLTGFSLSLLEEGLAHDLYNLQHSYHLEAGVQLLNRHAPSSKFHDFLCAAIPQQQFTKDQVWTATSAKLHHGASIHNKDFVLVSSTNAYKWQVARIEHHFEVQGVVYSIVTFCTCVDQWDHLC